MPQALSEVGSGFGRAAELGIKMDCFGKYLLNPEFGATGDMMEDLASFDRRIGRVSVHELGGIKGTFKGRESVMADRQSVWRVAQDGSPIEPTPVADVSSKYTLFDHKDVLLKVRDAIGSRQVNFRGSVTESGNRIHGLLIFEDPKFEVPLLTLFDDYVKLGLRFRNSVDGSLTWGGSAFGIRMICCNYNMWGDLLGKVEGRHTGNVEMKFDAMLENLLERAEKLLPQVNDKAWQDELDPEKTYELMLGAHTPPSYIPLVVNRLEELEPKIAEGHFNRYTMYQAVTAFITRSQVDDQRGDWLLKNATRYISMDSAKLVKEGERIIEKNREKELEQMPLPTPAP